MCGSDLRHHLIACGILLGLGAGLAASADAPLADAVMRGDKDVLLALPRDRQSSSMRHNQMAPRRCTGRFGATISTTADVLDQGGRGCEGDQPVRDYTDWPRRPPTAMRPCLRLLLDAGVDPKHCDAGRRNRADDGRPHRKGRRRPTVLLDRGANVNAKDTGHAQTALMWAVIDNDPLTWSNCSSRDGPTVNARTTAHPMPKGEFAPARAGRPRPEPGLIRQRALPDRQWRHDAAALCGARWPRRDDADALLDRGADLGQPSGKPDLAAAPSRCSIGQIRIATEPAREGGGPECLPTTTTAAALFAAIDLRKLQPRTLHPVSRPTAATRWI